MALIHHDLLRQLAELPQRGIQTLPPLSQQRLRLLQHTAAQ